MQLELQVYLNDILRSIDEIDSYFDGVIREFVLFVGDKKTQRAIERNLEIIGRQRIGYIRSNLILIFLISVKSLKHVIGSFMGTTTYLRRLSGVLSNAIFLV
jgi:hypothetical protein